MSVILSNTARYLRIAFKYKFELVVDGGYLIAWMIAFGIMASALFRESQHLAYSFRAFILVNIFFWAFMEKGYIEATRVIPEEARMGTLGTLMNNNVSPLSLIAGQMAARSMLNAVIAVVVFIPVFGYLERIEPLTAVNFLYLLIVVLLSWIYILTVAILMGSLALLFKKIGSTAGVLLQIFKVGSGFFFPVAAFGDMGWPLTYLPDLLRLIPVTRGLEVARDIIILGKLPGAEGSWFVISGISLDPIILMAVGVAAGIFISLSFYRYIEGKAMRLGIIEQY